MADYFNAAKRWNLAHGCQHVSPGCQGCWAERMATRHCNASTRGGRWSGEVVLFPERLEQPLHWRDPAVVAVQFMGDLFYERVPFEFIDRVFGAMWACLYRAPGVPGHDFLLLTKRPEQMLEYYSQDRRLEIADAAGRMCEDGDAISDQTYYHKGPHPRLWLGISAENQAELEKRWAVLRQVPAAHYWLSAEPLLGELNLERAIHRCHAGMDGECNWKHCPQLRDGEPERSGRHCPLDDDHRDDAIDPRPPRLSFVAVGCETGHKPRLCSVEAIRSVVRQCRDAGVRVHVKAVPVDGKPSKDPREWPEDLRVQDEVPRA